MKNEERNLERKWLFLLCMLILSIPQIVYRFHHQKMTETELFQCLCGVFLWTVNAINAVIMIWIVDAKNLRG